MPQLQPRLRRAVSTNTFSRPAPTPDSVPNHPAPVLHSFGQVAKASPKDAQFKLSVNTPGDAYEQEADATADAVMRMNVPSEGSSLQYTGEEGVQRTNLPITQRKEAGEEAGEDLATADVSDVVSQGLASGGRPLDPDTQAFMEPRFGHDFSKVRIHDSPAASSSASAIAARAYTVGSNIAFRSGEFSPGSGEGRRLLAHELTHVVQQGGTKPLVPGVQRQTAVSDLPSQRVQRDGPPPTAAPAPAAAAPPAKYAPPPEVPAMLPLDAQVTSVNTSPLDAAIKSFKFPAMTVDDVGWNGWAQINVLTSQTFWGGPNLANATTGGGIDTPLTPEDVSFPGGTNKYRLIIKAAIKNVTFESADGVSITQNSAGGGTLGSGGSITNTNTFGANATGSVGDPKAGGQATGGVSASSAVASTTSGQSGLQGTATTGSQSDGVRFHFDIDWSVTLLRDWSVGTGTAIFSLGMAEVSHLQVTPSQTLTAASTGAIMRFPKVRCIPIQ